ncbi:SAM-dependent methyltransferase [Streptomyces lonarensis]|uniref:S-adenosyl methyltransferase n=1 Tax=Streptomyces lonarensis TaxID=700599 RepID=A0A7X6HX07_9ACTN|nr:SAM-dependent methyltransferase [Streptomyces lonarensis]NJQ04033.1 hypothetical protein [Streptomyces lonarensis]
MSPHLHDEPATPVRRTREEWTSMCLTPAPARVDDRLRNGIDNYAVDRKLLDGLVTEAIGELREAIGASDRHTAGVAEQAARQGIRQALVLGAGLPIPRRACPEVHEVFDRHHGDDCTVVYVTDDPVAWALLRLKSNIAPGCADIILGDTRHIDTLLTSPHIEATDVDPKQPTVVALPGTLAWLTDDQARHALATLHHWLAPGSILTLTHPTPTDATRDLSLRWETAGMLWAHRRPAEVAALFRRGGFAGTVEAPSGLVTATYAI